MKSSPTPPSTGGPPPKATPAARRLQLVWPTKEETHSVLKIAFATNNRERVNQHFGTAESFAIYKVNDAGSALIAVSEFPEEAMDGHEGKLQAKVDFLEGCTAVFVMAIGASAIKLLMSKGVQPIRIAENDLIESLLADISNAIRVGGVQWVDRAVAKTRQKQDTERFTHMEDEGWQG